MTKNTAYVSEATNFINEMLKSKPELRKKQKDLRETWWDVGFRDQEEEKIEAQTTLPHDSYAYYSYNHK